MEESGIVAMQDFKDDLRGSKNDQTEVDFHLLRATELEKENEELKKRLNEEQKITECCICMENSRNAVLLPCSHFCCCSECSMNQDMCPICKEEITLRIKVYLS